MAYPLILPGKRALIAGRTGSGKTTLACWLLRRSPLHWLVLNPKHTSGYKSLPDSNIVQGFNLKAISKSLNEHRYTIVNPGLGETTPETLDLLVEWLHTNYEQIGLCCDELYTMHDGGRAGNGLIGWLTRGRELGQSFIGLTQRPAWISLFCFSESDYLAEMNLNIKKDRQRFFEFTGDARSLLRLPPREWLWYVSEQDSLVRYGSVPVK